MEFFRKYVLQIVTLVLCLLLLLVLQRQSAELETLKGELAQSKEVIGQLEGELAQSGEDILAVRDAQPLVTSCAFSTVETDGSSVTVEITAQLTLEDVSAGVLAHLPGESERRSRTECGLKQGADGLYRGKLTLPLELESGVEFVLRTYTDGEERWTLLRSFPSMLELLPVHLDYAEGDVVCGWTDGAFYFTEWSFEPKDGSGQSAEITDPILRVYHNGKLVLENTCYQFEERPGLYWDSEESSRLDCRDGDIIEFRFACTDRFGLRYEFPVKWWEIRDGQPVGHWPTSGYPTVTLAE